MQTEKKWIVFLYIWLIMLAIANAYLSFMSLLFLTIECWSGRFFHTDVGFYFTLAITPVLNIVFSIAAWKRKRWGVLGLGVMSIVTSYLLWLSSNFQGIAVGCVEIIVLAMLAMLAIPVWKYFKWR